MRRSFGDIVHLSLRGRLPGTLVQDEEDWRSLSMVARRMLFWCGGSIHGCRCQANEMSFALEMGHTTIGAVAHHISGGYSTHLRRRRGWSGRIFKRYSATSIDGELFLDDFVIWLHQSRTGSCWTGNSAYLAPSSSSWITTERVLAALSPGGAGRSVYLRRMTQPIDPCILPLLTGRSARRTRREAAEQTDCSSADPAPPRPLNIESIAQFVARYSRVSYEDMCSRSRRRDLSRAKILAAVLSTRNGASVAAVARLFGRSRSTLIERAERYRQTQPQLFVQAERALGTHLASMNSTASITA